MSLFRSLDANQEQHKNVLATAEQAADDSKSMVSTILGYHTMLVKLPDATDVTARKQLIKDLNKRVKTRQCKIPDKVMTRINAAAALPTAYANCTRCGKYKETWRVTAMSFLEFSGHAWAAIDFEVAVFMDLFDLGDDDLVLLCSF